MIQNRGAEFAIDADIFLIPVVQPDRCTAGTLVDGAHAVVEHHGDDAVGIAGIFRPFRFPGGREQRVASAARQIGNDVEMMDRALDQHRVVHRVAKQRTPRHVLAHVRLIAAGDVVHPPQFAGPDDPPQRRLVLVEAMTHRHRHLAARRLDLLRDPNRARHGVGDRLFAQHVDAVRDGDVDDRLVVIRWHDDGAEVGRHCGECLVRIGEARAVGQAEDLCSISERLGIEIDQRDDLDGAVIDVGAQEFATPALAEAADADMDDALLHQMRPGIGSAGPCV